jgi:hypothetical protein
MFRTQVCIDVPGSVDRMPELFYVTPPIAGNLPATMKRAETRQCECGGERMWGLRETAMM